MSVVRRKPPAAPRGGKRTKNILPLVADTLNLFEEDGEFVPAYTLSEASLPACPAGAKSAFCSQTGAGLFVLTSSAAFTLGDGDDAFSRVRYLSSVHPFVVDMYMEGMSVAVVFDGFERSVCTLYGTESAEDEHSFYTAVMHCGRLFARDLADGVRLVWSSGHALEWEEGIAGCGYICLPHEGGDILRLFSYGDRLVAVRRTGITVVRAYGEPENYRVEATASYLTADGIIAATCAPCGGDIYFCTRSGLYAFNGSSIVRKADFTEYGVSSPTAAAACGGEYFALCTHTGEEGAVFAYDAYGSRGCVCAFSADVLFAGADGVYAVVGQTIYRVERGGTGVWRSLAVRPAGGRQAHLSSLSAEGEGLAVSVGCASGHRTLAEGDGCVVGAYGGAFTFTVEVGGRLSGLEAVFTEVDDGV